MTVIDNYNFCDRHTHKLTLQLYDQPGPEGQVGGDDFESQYVSETLRFQSIMYICLVNLHFHNIYQSKIIAKEI